MKKFIQGFWKVIDDDIQSEGFTLYQKLTFGIIIPGLIGLLLVCVSILEYAMYYG